MKSFCGRVKLAFTKWWLNEAQGAKGLSEERFCGWKSGTKGGSEVKQKGREGGREERRARVVCSRRTFWVSPAILKSVKFLVNGKFILRNIYSTRNNLF